MSQLSLTITEKGTMMIALHNAIQYEKGIMDAWRHVNDKEGREIKEACEGRIRDYEQLQAKLKPATRPTQLTFL